MVSYHLRSDRLAGEIGDVVPAARRMLREHQARTATCSAAR